MSANKQTVETSIEGLNKPKHQQILSCPADDIGTPRSLSVGPR